MPTSAFWGHMTWAVALVAFFQNWTTQGLNQGPQHYNHRRLKNASKRVRIEQLYEVISAKYWHHLDKCPTQQWSGGHFVFVHSPLRSSPNDLEQIAIFAHSKRPRTFQNAWELSNYKGC
ncbi:hypothetical protein C8Q78DRAFT_987235 [Trametes maxima]|nr:hypothetical protein C8Q78DRAFT_987235 [Trametes maxima]